MWAGHLLISFIEPERTVATRDLHYSLPWRSSRLMNHPSALLYFLDEAFSERMELLLHEVGIASARAKSQDELSRLVKDWAPDVLLLDLDGPSRQAVALLALLQNHPTTPVLWFASSPTEDAVEGARRAGAAGILDKRAEPAEALRAIRIILRGEHFFPGQNTFPATPGAKGLAESERLLKVLGRVSGSS